MHSWGQGTGINAGVMLLAPNKADFLKIEAPWQVDLVAPFDPGLNLWLLLEPYHPAHVRGNGPEQDEHEDFHTLDHSDA